MGVRTVNDTDLGAVWRAATDELADEIVSAQQRAYLRLTRLRAIVEDTALLAVPDAFTRDVIESRLRPAITEALSRRLNRPIQVAVTVKPPEDGTGLPGTVYGTPVESAVAEEPQPRHYAAAEPEPMRQPEVPAYARDAYPESRPSYRNVPAARGGQEALFADPAPATMPPPPMPPAQISPMSRAPEPLPESNEAPPHRMATDPAQLRDNQRRPDDRPTLIEDALPTRGDNGPGRAPMDIRPSSNPRGTNDGNRLNPKYMFETFVIGSSNRFAHAAAVAVA